MVLLSVPDKLIVMTYLCQIRAFCTGQELQLVQLEGGGGAGTYRVASAQPSPPDALDAGGLAQRLREHRAEAPEEPKEPREPREAASRADGAAPKAASKDHGAEAAQEARAAEAPADGAGARASVPPAEGLANGAGAPGAGGCVRLRRPSVNGETGPVPPPRAHGSFSHVRDADLLKKRRSRLRHSSSFSGDEPDSGAAGAAGAGAAAAVSALPRRAGGAETWAQVEASGWQANAGRGEALSDWRDRGVAEESPGEVVSSSSGDACEPTAAAGTRVPILLPALEYMLVIFNTWHSVNGIMAAVGSSQKAPCCQHPAQCCLRTGKWVEAFLSLRVAGGQPAATVALESEGRVSILKRSLQGLLTPRFSDSGLELQMLEASVLSSLIKGDWRWETLLGTYVSPTPAGLPSESPRWLVVTSDHTVPERARICSRTQNH